MSIPTGFVIAPKFAALDFALRCMRLGCQVGLLHNYPDANSITVLAFHGPAAMRARPDTRWQIIPQCQHYAYLPAGGEVIRLW